MLPYVRAIALGGTWSLPIALEVVAEGSQAHLGVWLRLVERSWQALLVAFALGFSV